MEGYLMGRSSANSNGNYEEYRETAGKIAEKVQEQAQIMKERALDWFNTITQ